MSKRFNLGILTKEKYNDIKDSSQEDLIKNYGDSLEGIVSVGSLSREVFCIGKDFDDSFLKEFAKEVFVKKETNDLVNEESKFYSINQQGFVALINQLRIDIANNMEELLKDSEEDGRFSYIYFRFQEWNNEKMTPYLLEGDRISNSNHLEYQMFELIRIYKQVDWENELITISQW